MIVNWLLTRRCNRHCPFCGLVNDSKAGCYKKIDEVNAKELPIETTLETLACMNEIYPKDSLFHIFYGGEPFIKDRFDVFMKAVNDMNIQYTVITNSVLLDEVIRVFKFAGKYKGLTCSLDPIVMDESNKLNNIKNNAALKLLEANKELHMTDDMTVECVFDKGNLKYTKAFMEFMAKYYPDVSISISVYDYPKDMYYDFAANPNADGNYVDSMRIFPDDPEVIEAFDIIRDGIKNGRYNIHMGKADGFVDLIQDTCDSSYKCNIVYDEDPVSFPTLTIDADGEFRLCLRISGVTHMYAQDIFTSDKKVTKANLKKLKTVLEQNYDSYCKGCAWSCPMMDTFWDSSIDVAHGQECK